MYIPRTNNEVDGCPSGRVTCSTSSNNDPTPSASYDTGTGLHRFIGIGMVIIMAFMVLVGWLYFANYPRRKFPFLYRWLSCTRRSRGAAGPGDAEDQEVDDATQSTIVVADSRSSGKLKELISIGSLHQPKHNAHIRRASAEEDEDDDKTKCNMSVDATASVASPSRKSRRSSRRRDEGIQKQHRRHERDDPRRGSRREERARELEKTRNRMLQAEPRGLVKQVSGGVVMYSKPPRTPAPVVVRPRPHQPTVDSQHQQRQHQDSPQTHTQIQQPGSNAPVAAEWQFEHVHGVRFEARSPPRSQASNPPSSTVSRARIG